MQLNAVMCNGIDLNHCGSAGTIRSDEMNCLYVVVWDLEVCVDLLGQTLLQKVALAAMCT